MSKPANTELQKFVEVFDELCKFEAHNRLNRGYGCFKNDEVPFPEVVKVYSWLKQKCNRQEKDAIDDLIKKYEKKVHVLKVEALTAQNQNDFITMSTCSEEAQIYEDIIDDLKNIGGLK